MWPVLQVGGQAACPGWVCPDGEPMAVSAAFRVD
eukprot:SAG31_NODE_6156_length_2145_cov_2.099218_1_plen_33_part_10